MGPVSTDPVTDNDRSPAVTQGTVRTSGACPNMLLNFVYVYSVGALQYSPSDLLCLPRDLIPKGCPNAYSYLDEAGLQFLYIYAFALLLFACFGPPSSYFRQVL